MRADARSLLDRLGRSEFAYKEFADRFSDLELWPLFEALLRDPRVFQQEGADLDLAPAAPEAVPARGIAAARPAEPVQRSPANSGSSSGASSGAGSAGSLGELFSRYQSETGGGPQARQGQDVRAMLRRLSDLDARGEL